jgi:ATP-dependent protease Clp ATPase subunit
MPRHTEFMFLKRHEYEIPRCSFCSKTQDQIDTLVSNPSELSKRVCICNECIEVCNAVLEEHQKARAQSATVEDRLKASVLEESRNAKAADTLAARLKAFAVSAASREQ